MSDSKTYCEVEQMLISPEFLLHRDGAPPVHVTPTGRGEHCTEGHVVTGRTARFAAHRTAAGQWKLDSGTTIRVAALPLRRLKYLRALHLARALSPDSFGGITSDR